MRASGGEAADNVGMIELNISCPNVHGGGMGFGTTGGKRRRGDEGRARAVDKPLFVKLTPNVTDIAEIARAVRGRRARTESASSTPCWGCASTCGRKQPLLHNVTGRAVAVRRCSPWRCGWSIRCTKPWTSPSSGWAACRAREDVLEMMLAGATAVQVGAANLVNPTACRDIIDDLPAAAARLGVTALRDVIGAAHGGKQKGSERK